MREKCPNTEFFQARIFPYSEMFQQWNHLKLEQNRTKKNEIAIETIACGDSLDWQRSLVSPC